MNALDLIPLAVCTLKLFWLTDSDIFDWSGAVPPPIGVCVLFFGFVSLKVAVDSGGFNLISD